MEDKVLKKSFGTYDLQSITKFSKKRLAKIISQICIYTVLMVLSILATVLLGEYLWVFFVGIAVACVSAFMCYKWVKQISFADYSSACGEIVDVHKDVKIVDTKAVGGIGFGPRKYDSYNKSEVRLGVFIKNGEQVRGYFFNDGTEEHAKYYEAKGEAIHIWGTHFPVKLEIAGNKWLCPVCGEFNANEKKICVRCKKKILN